MIFEEVFGERSSYIFGWYLFKNAKIYGEQIALHIFFVLFQGVILISSSCQSLTKSYIFSVISPLILPNIFCSIWNDLPNSLNSCEGWGEMTYNANLETTKFCFNRISYWKKSLFYRTLHLKKYLKKYMSVVQIWKLFSTFVKCSAFYVRSGHILWKCFHSP